MNCYTIRLFFLSIILVVSQSSFLGAATLDQNFGNDGRVAVELGVYGDRANAVVVQPDGNIVVGGSSSNAADLDFMLFRLTPDGSLDPAFNYDGTVTTAIGYFDDEILALALQQDGKIIAVGYSSNGMDRDFALARYNSDGSLDRHFGTEGMIVTAVGNSHDEITSVILQEDGKILVAGSAQGTGGRIVVLARYLADGTVDTHFADDGFALTGVGSDAQAEDVALLAEGRIVVSGSYSEENHTGLMLVGFKSDGSLDSGFGRDGIAVAADGSRFSEGYGMFIRLDDKILVAGSVGEEGERDATLFQFTADGSPDKSFEENGVLVTPVGDGDDVLYDVIVTGEMIAASGFKTVVDGREFLFITYKNSKVTIQQVQSGKDEEDAWIQISELQYHDSLEKYNDSPDEVHLIADVESTAFDRGRDTSTALAAVSLNSFVVVGESAGNYTSSAAVSKYTTTEISLAGTMSVSDGSKYILTFEPYDVTRTSAIIPVEILSGLGSVSQRGVVFSTMPSPVLQDGDDGGDNDDGDDGGDDITAPVITNETASSFQFGESVTLSISTSESATCKYDTSDLSYSSMTGDFSDSGTSHSVSLGTLSSGTYTYYARCQDDSGNENSSGTAMSFTVESEGGDITPPVITNTTDSDFDYGQTVTLQVSTDETATCKYDPSDSDYEYMGESFSENDSLTHSQVLSLDTDPDYTYTYRYYVRCMDSFGNVSSSGTAIDFTVNSSDSDTSPPTITNGTEDCFTTAESVALSITTDERATCKYDNDDSVAYAAMSGSFTEQDSTTHSADLGVQQINNYVYYARCEDLSGNSNNSGTEMSFSVQVSCLPPPPAASAEKVYPHFDLDTHPSLFHAAMQTVGGVFIGTAMAADDDDTETSTDDEEDFLEEGHTSEGSGIGTFYTKPKNLKPGTFFYVRAYAVVDGKTYYGNQVGFRTADSCFVATAAFGSIFHPYVQILRGFRDSYMLDNQVGRGLVSLYYRASPAVADVIADSPELRFATRILLLPVVGAAWLVIQLGFWGLLLPVGMGGCIWLAAQVAAVKPTEKNVQ